VIKERIAERRERWDESGERREETGEKRGERGRPEEERRREEEVRGERRQEKICEGERGEMTWRAISSRPDLVPVDEDADAKSEAEAHPQTHADPDADPRAEPRHLPLVAGPGRSCSPRHMMPVNSRNKGVKGRPMTCRAMGMAHVSRLVM
jgi:hypothetical protein